MALSARSSASFAQTGISKPGAQIGTRLTSWPIFRMPVTPLGALWASVLYAGEQTGGTFPGYISHKMPRTDGGVDDKVVVPE